MKKSILFVLFSFILLKTLISQNWEKKITYDEWGDKKCKIYCQIQQGHDSSRNYTNNFTFSGFVFAIVSVTDNIHPGHIISKYQENTVTLKIRDANHKISEFSGQSEFRDNLSHKMATFSFLNPVDVYSIYKLLQKNEVYDILIEGNGWYIKSELQGGLNIDLSSSAVLEINETDEGKCVKVRDEYRYIVEEITIPEGCQIISEGGFADCRFLKVVNAPKSLRKLENLAFFRSGLRKIDISDVSEFGYVLFDSCICLEEIKNPHCKVENGFVIIDDKLNSVLDCKYKEIPNGVKVIGAASFACNVYEQQSIFKYFSSIVIPGTVYKIEDAAFSDSPIKSIKLPKSIQIIEQYAFAKCKDLQTVIIENGSKLVELNFDKVFYCCDNLKSITLPKSVKLFNVPGNVQIIYY